MTCTRQSKTLCLRPGAIASKAAVVVALVLCAGLLITLIPDRDELFKRHLADGDADAARALLDRESDGDSSSATVALTAEAIRICEEDEWAEESIAMLTGFVRHNKHFQPAAEEVLRRAGEMPDGPRARVLTMLVERALADGDLEFAQSVQRRIIDGVATLTPDLVRQAVTTFRYNNNSGLALSVINRLGESGPLPEDLEQLRVDLARGVGQPGVAFALLEDRIRRTNDPATLRKLIPAAVKNGVEAGRQNDLIPLYEKFLAMVPATDGEGEDPLRAEYSMKLAQTYEWTSQPVKAFEVYLELAGKGHRDALDRCLALNPGLFRTGSLLAMLTRAYDHYREDDKIVLLTARLLAEAARREEAVRLYRDYLDRNPEDAAAHALLGFVFDEAQEFEKASECYEAACSLAPQNRDYLGKAARLAVSLGRYEKALARFRELSMLTRRYEEAAGYYSLAKSLGDLGAIKEALQFMIEFGSPFETHYRITLAGVYHSNGDLDGAVEILEKSLKAQPDEPFIRIELAERYLEQKRFDPALKMLKPVSISRQPRMGPVILSALGGLAASGRGSVDAYLQRYGRALETNVELDPSDLLQLAELFRANGEGRRATGLLRRVVRKSNRPGELARAHFYLGEADAARRNQLEHLRGITTPTSEDYRMLGDIYTELSNRSEADKAYRKALELLQKPRLGRR